jgi:hypothetical protein
MSLPSNDALIAFSETFPWQEIERQKRQFNRALEKLVQDSTSNELPLESLSDAIGAPVTTYYDSNNTESGNVILAHGDGRSYVLGSVVSARYRSGHSFLESVVPYNLNPSVNHTNLHETEDSVPRMRVLGAEIELGLIHPDGHSPSEDEMQNYMRAYYNHALRIGIYPRLDREACQYQVEAHIAPSIGYTKTRNALNGIMTALASASDDTGLITAIMSTYPTLSDFRMTDHPKVATAVDLMLEVNSLRPEAAQRLAETHKRYHVDPTNSHYVNMFRIQGCHIHIDLAGRSEALGLLTFHTMLKSATALANAAVLKGAPFVNGTCDPVLLDAREFLRRTTVTGRYLDLPTSPHFQQDGLEHYAELLKLERANAVGRALLYEDGLGEKLSVMHNPVGRVRSDLSTAKRVCTVESTGMPANVSASRMAAVLTDFEFTHALIEIYFRKFGCDLEPMYDDLTLWAILGPLDLTSFQHQHDMSDHEGSDVVLTTAAGTQMSLAEFYEMKRRYMHRALEELPEILPRDIDEVYNSLCRMLEPPSGHAAQSIHEYILDPKLRSTGNWGRILRNAFIEAGGSPGEHNPELVLRVVNEVHQAMRTRFLEN